ncbi:hypothetical protein MD535_23810 [Vibrio sp. ZSDZ65]|uniref:Uncharacterized protein n=1 Tax=Vibrio qingdaonensis TaxID=2829491 RepID=A0A9X3CT28_9VIBR|nr:hypothetical protein [Vibrio qingdaonensis]MCW8349021.1 hypothetical protein [Vibrio qingdaonensis]
MKLELTTRKYKSFLIAFRKADIDAKSGAEITVSFETNQYHFESPNFKLVAYTQGTTRYDLTTYNHTDMPNSLDLGGLEGTLRKGGSGLTKMNGDLSTVVAATSEAARSKVVEAAFTKVLLGKTIMLQQYEVLFKAYNQPARFNGLLNQDGSYNSTWRALKKEDYIHFFNSQEYTGSSSDMLTKLVAL